MQKKVKNTCNILDSGGVVARPFHFLFEHLDPGEAVFLSFRERKEILSFASAYVTQSDFLPRGND